MTPESITYKPSGIDWLGDIPSHWNIVRFRIVFDYISRGDTPSYADTGRIKVINQACIQHLNLLLENVKYNVETDISDYKGLVRKNDLLINSTGTGTLGRIGIFDRENDNEFFVDSHVTILRSSNPEVLPKFYYYFLVNKQELITALASEGSTNQIELQREKLRSLFVPLPPLQEQIEIVAHLENKLTDIEEFLSQKQRFIDLLREQKQAIINEAVTKGVYPQHNDNHLVTQGDYHYAEDTPWLDGVPGHWEVRRLKLCAKIIYGISPNETTYNDEGKGTVLINGPVEYSETDFGITRSMKWTTKPQKFASKGALLFCLRGSTTGRLNVCHDDVSIGRGVAAIISHYDQRFMIYVFFMLRKYITSSFQGSTFPSITSQELGNYFIPLPPLAEQAEIVDHIERETGRVDQLANQAKREMALMQEYRSALVTETVTRGLPVEKRVREKRLQVGI